jgi:hypothetical protein
MPGHWAPWWAGETHQGGRGPSCPPPPPPLTLSSAATVRHPRSRRHRRRGFPLCTVPVCGVHSEAGERGGKNNRAGQEASPIGSPGSQMDDPSGGATHAWHADEILEGVPSLQQLTGTSRHPPMTDGPAGDSKPPLVPNLLPPISPAAGAAAATTTRTRSLVRPRHSHLQRDRMEGWEAWVASTSAPFETGFQSCGPQGFFFLLSVVHSFADAPDGGKRCAAGPMR